MHPEPPWLLGPPAVRDRSSLREQVTHALRAALVGGELHPGVVYSAPVLAAEFGVSATPVREAMLDLAKEGLVETVRNKGFRVLGLSPQDLDDITETRVLIEVPVTVRVARSAERSDLEALRGLARETVRAARAGDLAACGAADRAFHLTLLALGGNRRLTETVGELRRRSLLAGLSRLASTGRLVASAKEHERLLDLMLRRDPDAVEALLRSHLNRVPPDSATRAAPRGSGERPAS
ncbi:GntR family transcriptional regulator [Streptacidiphilus cavernicola]|uniref:GntR family transcriptional regulator n=1 Tax=Streptacidiphilus cavernicola TaxID=3342716 RepID=A0ABV6VQJ1_9ACTN